MPPHKLFSNGRLIATYLIENSVMDITVRVYQCRFILFRFIVESSVCKDELQFNMSFASKCRIGSTIRLKNHRQMNAIWRPWLSNANRQRNRLKFLTHRLKSKFILELCEEAHILLDIAHGELSNREEKPEELDYFIHMHQKLENIVVVKVNESVQASAETLYSSHKS